MAGQELAVDRIRCDGRGACAELLPEAIRLDDWGYPILDPGPLPDGLLPHARRAVKSLPGAGAATAGRTMSRSMENPV